MKILGDNYGAKKKESEREKGGKERKDQKIFKIC